MRELQKTVDGARIVADKLLGAGGQGEVWRATDTGQPVAVKIYHPHTATADQRQVLERLVAKGRPAPQFLWPLAMVHDPRQGTFGYTMPLREPNFRALEDFMARRIEPSMRALLTAGLQLADGFLRLHSQGLCYRDISFANVFFDPDTGDVRICDNDNVDVSGTETGGVLGTQRFMAPEVVRREAVPSDQTDRYSLAVLLFFLLYGGHPLDGKREASIRCLDVPALERLYGTAPLYIWDPDDDSNRPVPGVHDNPIAFRDMYPEALAALFRRSFTEGLLYPSKRVRESEWRKAFAAAIDSVWMCSCGAESFYEPAAAGAAGGKRCWACHKPLVLPPRIRLGAQVVLLNRSTRLFGHHVGHTRDDGTAIAEVAANPKSPGSFGLRNLTSEGWTLMRPDGSVVDVPPGRAAPIVDGNRINFGLVTGEIRA
jgi:DNA-binding helix-hairpin-helix protein with protein kinase domain